MNLILASSSAAGSTGVLLIWIVAMIALMYFLMIRPQKKEQNRVNAMLNDLEKGDSVVTTSGFYGVVLDITDEDVIVEFGNNKNCRIPMKKTAIAEVEKASDGYGDAPAEKKAENAKPADKKKAPAEDKFEKK